MNIPDSLGESSSKRQENGDAPTGSERPLKKARFAWQVKGKYHLKNDTNDANKSSTMLTTDTGLAGTSSEGENVSRDLVGSTEQNLEILGDYLLKQDFNTLDSVIADSEKSLLKPACLQDNTSMATQSLEYPRYVSSYESGLRSHRSSASSNEHIAIPMSMIVPQSYSEDQCIARWQAKQMAKGFVDNTINRVLDSWSHPPTLPDTDDASFLAIDIAEFIDNMPEYNNSVENEGILMAISAHGLQNTSASSSSNNSENKKQGKAEVHKFISPPSSPLPSEEELSEPIASEQRDSELLWPYPEEFRRNNELSQFSINDPSSPCQYYNENDSIQTDNTDYGSADNVSGDHFDFMDTAVSFAILNKGLTTFGNDYG